jgi:hypothetical protein
MGWHHLLLGGGCRGPRLSLLVHPTVVLGPARVTRPVPGLHARAALPFPVLAPNRVRLSHLMTVRADVLAHQDRGRMGTPQHVD